MGMLRPKNGPVENECAPESDLTCQMITPLTRMVGHLIGAGDENRTRVLSLGS